MCARKTEERLPQEAKDLLCSEKYTKLQHVRRANGNMGQQVSPTSQVKS